MNALPYVDATVDFGVGTWFLAYDQSEGFQPWVLLVRSDDIGDVADVWMEHERNADVELNGEDYYPEQLVVTPAPNQGIPDSHPVQPLKWGQTPPGMATCLTCDRSWDDSVSTSMTPAPAGRCPFEYYHGD